MDTIIGAGFAGLIAAHAWPQARIFEASPEPKQAHKALLRFRSDAVARLTGIEFRAVNVRKGIYSERSLVNPSIRMANLYSRKVIGLENDRSIWNLDPVVRYVAPENFHEQLLEAVGRRIRWNCPSAGEGKTVSTAPLPSMLKAHGIEHDLQFVHAPIWVARWRIPKCDLFQTIYFPDADTGVYRASITKDLLIVEVVGEEVEEFLPMLEHAFGIDLQEAEPLLAIRQTYGKIAAINNDARKDLLFQLTHNHSIYSLGRFATWRNILLDDVVDDIAVIKRLGKAKSAYDLKRSAV